MQSERTFQDDLCGLRRDRRRPRRRRPYEDVLGPLRRLRNVAVSDALDALGTDDLTDPTPANNAGALHAS